MEKYTVTSWYPTTSNFYARNKDGVAGLLNTKGFVPMPEWHEEAARLKYHYKAIPPQEVSVNEVPALVKALSV